MRSRTRVVSWVVVASGIALGVLPVGAPSAHACSCEEITPAQLIERVDAAFVGIPVSSQEVDPDPETGSPRLAVTFEVVEALKGDMGDTVVLYADNADTSCGSSPYAPGSALVGTGTSVGVTVYALRYASNGACEGLSALTLHIGAEGLPPPMAGAEIVALTPAWSLGVDHAAIGSDGRVVAWARPGDGVAYEGFVLCVNGVTTASVVTGGSSGGRIVWRAVTGEEVASVPVPHGEFPRVLACIADQRALVATGARGFLVGPDAQEVDLGSGTSDTRWAVDPTGRLTASSKPNALITITDVATGSVLRTVEPSELPFGMVSDLAFLPAGDRLAVLTYDGSTPRLTIVPVEGGALTTHDREGYLADGVWWLDDTTVATATPGLRVTAADGGPARGYAVTGFDTPVVGVAGSRAVTSYNDGPALRTELIDLVDGTALDLSPDPADAGGLLGPIVPLPHPVPVPANEAAPASVALPLPGVHLPATLEELVGPAGDDDPDVTADDAPTAAPTVADPEDDEFPIVPVALAATAFVLAVVTGVAMIRRRRSTYGGPAGR